MDHMVSNADLSFWCAEEETFFGQVLNVQDNSYDNSGGQFTMDIDAADIDALFATFIQGSKVPYPELGCLQSLEVEPTGGEVDGEEHSSDDEIEEVLDGGRPTTEEIAAWESHVVRVGRPREWKAHTGKRLQSRCFSVEWRSSVLVDGREFVRRLLSVVGGEASFVLGMDIRKSRADYFVVVRLFKLGRWRDWWKVLMFGHGGYDAEEGLFMRVCVPRRRDREKGIHAFVNEMLLTCDTYSETCRYKEPGLFRLQSRAGKKKKKTDVGDEIDTN
jgi:hypothetical protein